jgi:hypothetical protein
MSCSCSTTNRILRSAGTSCQARRTSCGRSHTKLHLAAERVPPIMRSGTTMIESPLSLNYRHQQKSGTEREVVVVDAVHMHVVVAISRAARNNCQRTRPGHVRRLQQNHDTTSPILEPIASPAAGPLSVSPSASEQAAGGQVRQHGTKPSAASCGCSPKSSPQAHPLADLDGIRAGHRPSARANATRPYPRRYEHRSASHGQRTGRQR